MHLPSVFGWLPQTAAARPVAPATVAELGHHCNGKRQMAEIPECLILQLGEAYLGMQHRRVCICRLCPVGCLGQQLLVLWQSER